MARRRGKRGVKAEFVGPKITVPRATGGVLGVKNRCAPCYGGYFFIRAHFFASEPGGLVGVLKIKNQCARGYRGCFEGQQSLGPVLQGVFFIRAHFFCIRTRCSAFALLKTGLGRPGPTDAKGGIQYKAAV